MGLFISPRPAPDQQFWGKIVLACLVALLLAGGLGYLGVVRADTAITEIAKNAGARALGDHIALLSVALMVMPVFGIPALMLVVPLAGLLCLHERAGPLSLVLLSWAVGLPLVHIIFLGDLTTKAPDLLIYILCALAGVALTTWAQLRFGPLRLRPAPLSMAGNTSGESAHSAGGGSAPSDMPPRK